MTAPISPDEVAAGRAGGVPEIIEAANELLLERWDGSSARFDLSDLSDRARVKLGRKWDAPFANGELDIEPVFRAAGWDVVYHGSDRGSPLSAYFLFTRPAHRCAFERCCR